MDNYKLDLGIKNGIVNVKIIRRPIKNIHLKVYRDFTVSVSVPDNVPDEWINSFLKERILWIDKQVTKYKNSGGYNSLLDIKNGTSVQLLGKDMRIIKNLSLVNSVELDEKTIIVNLKDISDTNNINKILNKWWREKANEIYSQEMNILFDKIFKKYNLSIPEISIKKMKTMWGSCSKAKNKITLNEYLLKADLRCIQYVILHELTHLLYNYHNSDFYDFLTIQMPDWQERKKHLDKDVVQGLA